MSHLTQSMVEQFFAREEENARGVLRKEMDSAMDTIFKQMKRKLMQLVESGPGADETGHGLTDLDVLTDHEQQLYSSLNDTNHIPSATTNSHAHFSHMNASNLSLQGESGDQQHHEQHLHFSSNQFPSTSTNSRNPDNLNQDDEIIVKNELDELVNIIPMPTSSTQSQPSNDDNNDVNLLDELDDDEEDCDCSECVGDLFVVKEEGDANDNSHSAEDLIDEDPSRPTKRPRLEDDQVHDQAQANNQNIHNKYITISLKCLQCSEMFQGRDELNAHLKSVHSIEKYRCLYKDCNQSFDMKTDLTHHFSTAHSERPNTMLSCGYCSVRRKDSKTLYNHYFLQHEEGLFQCAQSNCQFVAELKQAVYNHYLNKHKYVFVCQHPACTKHYSSAAKLKIHQRTHFNARPYRCKWPNCEFVGSAHKHNVIRHIHTHLAKIVKHRTNISHDPNDYLEVMNELL